MPRPAPVPAAALERIGVEIVRPLARQAAQRPIVERALHHVGVGAVEIEMQHPLRPEDQRDRGAGLGVGGFVGQVVGLGEAFVALLRPEPGGHVHLRRRHVAPQRLAGALEARVVEFEREVGHRRGHVHRAHRVPDHLGLLAHRHVRLVVFVGPGPEGGRLFAARDRFLGEVVRLAAALVDEIGGEIEAAAIAGQPIELDQRQLDFLVAVVAALLACPAPEGSCDVVDIAFHDVEEAPPTGGAEVGDRPFKQMAGVVKLVVVAQVGPALVRFAAVVPAIEIAVGRLGACEIVDDRVDLRFDVGVAPVRQRVARRLDPFADVGVPEHLHGEVVFVARDRQRRNGLGELQRVENSRLVELGVLARNRAR